MNVLRYSSLSGNPLYSFQRNSNIFPCLSEDTTSPSWSPPASLVYSALSSLQQTGTVTVVSSILEEETHCLLQHTDSDPADRVVAAAISTPYLST